MSALKDLEGILGRRLSKVAKILLSTTGSVTATLEVVSGLEVKVETRFQGVVKAGELPLRPPLEAMGLHERERVNIREVWLATSERRLAFAISLSPTSRLEPSFSGDLTRADVPIGKLLSLHEIESRREIREIGLLAKIPSFLKSGFGLSGDALVAFRSYDVIRHAQVMMEIYEFFHPML
ncbi:MAG: chorismate pyruvate-lyase family protein [Promethearchaeota archaeon]